LRGLIDSNNHLQGARLNDELAEPLGVHMGNDNLAPSEGKERD
jgi:hypothetical protein